MQWQPTTRNNTPSFPYRQSSVIGSTEKSYYNGITPEVKCHACDRGVSFLDGWGASLPSYTRRAFEFNDKDSLNPGERGLRLQLDVLKNAGDHSEPMKRPSVPVSSILNILRTCKQVHSETSVIFWVENAFVFYNIYSLFFFLFFLGQRPCRYLRKLEIERVGLDMLSADLIMSWFSTEFENMSMWKKTTFLYSHVMLLLMGFKEYHSEGMIPLKDSYE